MPTAVHPSLTSTRLLGIRLDAGSPAAATKLALEAALRREGGLVCVANVDMVTRAKRTPKLRQLMEQATAVVTDGMPLVWSLRHLHGRRDVERVYGPGLVLSLCAQAARDNIGVYFYGGSPDEGQGIREALQARWPELRIAGIVSPPLLPAEPSFDEEAVANINASGAGLLFVGLGCPKQEYWMAAQQPHLRPISIGVGLAFALIAGTKSQAPEWMRNAGLEWFYRLCQEPGRLWKRYLVGNSLFIWWTLQEWVRPRAEATPPQDRR